MFRKSFGLLMLVLIAISAVSAQNSGKVRQLDKETTDRYLAKISKGEELQLLPPMATPATVIHVMGTSYTGLTVHGYNAVDLPDGTVMIGLKGSTLTGPQETLSAVQFGGTFPAGQFRYPMEDGKRTNWTDRPTALTYQLYTFFPNGEISTTTAYKDVTKYWSGQIGSPRFIQDGSSQMANGVLTINLVTTLSGNGPVAIVIKDADVDYNQTAIPASAIKRKGNQISINATAAGFTYGANADIAVIVTDGLSGLSDQYLVRGPLETVVIPSAK